MELKRLYYKYANNLRYALDLRKPVFLYRVTKVMLQTHLLRMQKLRYVDVAINYKCNLKCSHCFATALEKKGEDPLTLEDYRRVAREAMKLGAVNFSFQGGEPLFSLDKLVSVIQCFSPHKNIISVTTNATLLTEENLMILREAGVNILTISLDSGIEEEHDAFRGVAETHRKVLESISRARSYGFNVTIGVTVSKKNITSDGFLKLLDYTNSEKLITFLSLAAPLGRWDGENDLLLDDQDMETIANYQKKYKMLRTDFEANYVKWGCGAAKEILYLTPYGDVLPCPYLHFSLGNVKKSSLVKIQKAAIKKEYLKSYYGKCLAATDPEFIQKLQKHRPDNGKLTDVHEILG